MLSEIFNLGSGLGSNKKWIHNTSSLLMLTNNHVDGGPSLLVIQAIGFGVSVILTVLQLPLLRMSRSTKVPFVAKFVANGAFSLVGCYATLESFRGVWYLMDAYYMTGMRGHRPL